VSRQSPRAALESRIEDADFPCLGAKSALHLGRATVRVFGELGAVETAGSLLSQLRRFAASTNGDGGFASFVAVFAAPAIESELQFEELLWRELLLVHDLDTEPWSEAVSRDPGDDDFAFSAAGTAYFIVGLHPRASRLARRFDYPALVFNLHAQFEALRRAGGYERMRDAIRGRDERLQGSINPMVCDHGRSSAACQYSGRAVEASWQAPFEFRGRNEKAA
jgi:hypothetical protein